MNGSIKNFQKNEKLYRKKKQFAKKKICKSDATFCNNRKFNELIMKLVGLF